MLIWACWRRVVWGWATMIEFLAGVCVTLFVEAVAVVVGVAFLLPRVPEDEA